MPPHQPFVGAQIRAHTRGIDIVHTVDKRLDGWLQCRSFHWLVYLHIVAVESASIPFFSLLYANIFPVEHIQLRIGGHEKRLVHAVKTEHAMTATTGFDVERIAREVDRPCRASPHISIIDTHAESLKTDIGIAEERLHARRPSAARAIGHHVYIDIHPPVGLHAPGL